MTAVSPLSDLFLQQWRGIRRLTYDYLHMLSPEQLSLRLPFPRSKSLGYQFWCMTGAHESYLKELEMGAWQGFSCSLNGLEEVTPAVIAANMRTADAAMAQLLATTDLSQYLRNGKRAFEVVQRMIEHEMHHQGQLINYMFCHGLSIPPSWQEKWALAYDEES